MDKLGGSLTDVFIFLLRFHTQAQIQIVIFGAGYYVVISASINIGSVLHLSFLPSPFSSFPSFPSSLSHGAVGNVLRIRPNFTLRWP